MCTINLNLFKISMNQSHQSNLRPITPLFQFFQSPLNNAINTRRFIAF